MITVRKANYLQNWIACELRELRKTWVSRSSMVIDHIDFHRTTGISISDVSYDTRGHIYRIECYGWKFRNADPRS